MSNQLLLGDCLNKMMELEPNSIDSIVTDPPYGLKFMCKDWDHGIPGTHFWEEALRVAKPGAFLLAFGGTRTFHRLTCYIEDAGWEIRDCIMWVYGSGFPKSHDVSKAIDRAAGAEREVIGKMARPAGTQRVQTMGRPNGVGSGWQDAPNETAPATDAARQWDGWGTALKPAWEPIIVARKPLVGTVASNVLQYGTGGINVDGCRVGTEDNLNGGAYSASVDGMSQNDVFGKYYKKPGEYQQPQGRFPANLILSWPEDEYELRDNVTPEQLRKLAGWLDANR